MRLKTREDVMIKKATRGDLMTGENPWNGAREAVGSVMNSRSTAPKCMTLEKLVIQPPDSASAAVTRWGQPTYRVWCNAQERLKDLETFRSTTSRR